MHDHEMKICKCGRIHMISMEKINTAVENNKDLLLICGGCGNAMIIGADIEPDWDDPNEDCRVMYSNDYSEDKDAIFTTADFESSNNKKGFSEIIYSHGIKVPMMTGQDATDYFDGRFSDRWYPDFYKIQRKDVTVDEIMKFIETYTHDRTTVNMQRFINQVPEEIIEEISHYYIQGFDWKGTKWERNFTV